MVFRMSSSRDFAWINIKVFWETRYGDNFFLSFAHAWTQEARCLWFLCVIHINQLSDSCGAQTRFFNCFVMCTLTNIFHLKWLGWVSQLSQVFLSTWFGGAWHAKLGGGNGCNNSQQWWLLWQLISCWWRI